MRQQIIESLISRIKKRLVTERKSDEISLKISRVIIKQFNKKEDFEIEGITFERGDEYASFDLYCSFIKEEDYNEPFSISAEADAETLEIEITYDPKAFPKNMKDLVAEVKETVEHELEHIEQQNFEDMDVNDEFEYEDDDFFEYCISNKEVPAFVRGLIKRSKTKKITLNKAMDEWFKENHRRFSNPDEEWPKVKKVWTDFANKMRSKEKVKKFK
jgi:hypothetical protein